MSANMSLNFEDAVNQPVQFEPGSVLDELAQRYALPPQPDETPEQELRRLALNDACAPLRYLIATL